MRDRLGNDFEKFRESLESEPVVSIRLNPNKPAALDERTPVPWCSDGRYLKDRPVFTLDPLFHAGAYYVQEASSMFLGQALAAVTDLAKPLRVLDLCAAPGGKSTHLLSLLSPESLLVSNEVIRTRATILAENITKWGHANVIVTNNDPIAFQQLGEYFDVIVVDAPCSGEGLFRKDHEAVAEWSEANAHLCSLRQRRILNDVWPALKPGGHLIYCTCTYNQQENEINLQHFAGETGVTFRTIQDTDPDIGEVRAGAAIGYQMFPHKVQGEGFFLSILQKEESTVATRRRKHDPFRTPLDFPRSFLAGDFSGTRVGDLWVAWPENLTSDFTYIAEVLNVVTRGTAVGTAMKDKIIPDHALALSIHLRRDHLASIALAETEALAYLRKEPNIGNHALLLDGSRGFALITYQEMGLGWVNRIGNRVNNLYPSGWRVRM